MAGTGTQALNSGMKHPYALCSHGRMKEDDVAVGEHVVPAHQTWMHMTPPGYTGLVRTPPPNTHATSMQLQRFSPPLEHMRNVAHAHGGCVEMHGRPAPAPVKLQRSRKRTKAGRYTSDITYQELSNYFHLPTTQACKKIGVGLTIFKRICRKFGLERWPYKRVPVQDYGVHKKKKKTHSTTRHTTKPDVTPMVREISQDEITVPTEGYATPPKQQEMTQQQQHVKHQGQGTGRIHQPMMVHGGMQGRGAPTYRTSKVRKPIPSHATESPGHWQRMLSRMGIFSNRIHSQAWVPLKTSLDKRITGHLEHQRGDMPAQFLMNKKNTKMYDSMGHFPPSPSTPIQTLHHQTRYSPFQPVRRVHETMPKNKQNGSTDTSSTTLPANAALECLFQVLLDQMPVQRA